ncbi:hypothetical protein KNU84_gp088 [Bacteriophage DSS3_VP1]|uniref:Uncharacterized protein n=1 Tax=Bacteriophage DSS3_VP1 TaxID=2664196 RepID=A0A7S5FRE1_9CAUD|nr:hypothetical protein KNU84_gp088 [Bacteriophage DSS3_VP1]QGH74616.1 hypothetical protein DSS3VP1_00048 [Bacteriophage DSS3_VP1]
MLNKIKQTAKAVNNKLDAWCERSPRLALSIIGLVIFSFLGFLLGVFVIGFLSFLLWELPVSSPLLLFRGTTALGFIVGVIFILDKDGANVLDR